MTGDVAHQLGLGLLDRGVVERVARDRGEAGARVGVGNRRLAQPDQPPLPAHHQMVAFAAHGSGGERLLRQRAAVAPVGAAGDLGHCGRWRPGIHLDGLAIGAVDVVQPEIAIAQPDRQGQEIDQSAEPLGGGGQTVDLVRLLGAVAYQQQIADRRTIGPGRAGAGDLQAVFGIGE